MKNKASSNAISSAYLPSANENLQPVLAPNKIFAGDKWNKNLLDFRILFKAFLLSLRNSFLFQIFLQTVVPIAFVFAMGHYAGVTLGNDQLIRIVSGTITFNLAYLGLMSLSARLAGMKEDGTLVYFWALPISKASFVSAILASRLVMLLPSIVVPIVAGSLMYSITLNINWSLLLIIPLSILSLASIGTALGVLLKGQELVVLVANALIFVMALAAPTFMPTSILPLPLQILGIFLPTTYTSDALSHCFKGLFDTTYFIDVVVLFGMGIGSLLLVSKFLKWRTD